MMAGMADNAWKSKEQGEEAQYDVREKEQAQLSASIQRARQEGATNTAPSAKHDFEGGFGGQEDLEDRYATTSGEH